MRLHSPAITGSLTVSGSINIQGDSISTYKTDFYTGGLTPSHYFGRNTSNNAFPIATFNHAGGASFFIVKTKISGSINTTGSFGMVGVLNAAPESKLHIGGANLGGVGNAFMVRGDNGDVARILAGATGAGRALMVGH